MKLILLVAALSACGSKAADDPKAIDQASLLVKKLAFEAYPTWAMKHPEAACPKSAAELAESFEDKSLKDPWGHEVRTFCGASLPKGARGGFAAASAGPDGAFDTADDIKSW